MSDEKPSRHRHQAAAAHYIALAGILRTVAREHGYALGVHGSLATDMDLIAAPWVDDAKPAEALIEALRECVGGFMNNGPFTSCSGCLVAGVLVDCPHVAGMHNPSTKPHGRRAWSIHLAADFCGPYLDVSVMPRIET